MTKDEFLKGIKEGAADIDDPDSDLMAFITEGAEIAKELEEHDPVLATKVLAVCTAVKAIGDYIKLRAEQRTEG